MRRGDGRVCALLRKMQGTGTFRSCSVIADAGNCPKLFRLKNIGNKKRQRGWRFG